MNDNIQIVIELPTEILEDYLRISKLNNKSFNEQILHDLSHAIQRHQEEEGQKNISRDDGVGSIRDARETAEAATVRNALQRNEWNISQTAKELGISRPTLYNLMAKYEI